MNPDRLRQVQSLFHEVCSHAPAEREAFLRAACGGDEELFRQVWALAAQDPSSPMDRPVMELAAQLLDSPAVESWVPGTLVGPYRIERLLGEGGMGDVYKARDTRLGRDVAIKTAKQGFGARFQREARAISALNHPNICTLYDVGPNYLVMEYIDGVPVAGPLPVAGVLRLAAQIAEAVRHAHDHGVIHRDLKPGNILLTKSGVKVLDFGLAKISLAGVDADATRPHSDLTEMGAIMGTLRYMAPEQLKGQEADRRSDIFAFGVVLSELLTGQPAFEGNTQADLIASILTAEVRLEEVAPPALQRLIRACTAKDAERRRQTMQDILLDLEWMAAGEPPVRAEVGRRRIWITAVVAAVAGLGVGDLHSRHPAEPRRFPVKLQQPLPPGVHNWIPAIAPDGRSFAYSVDSEGADGRLWVRRLDQEDAVYRPEARGGYLPFWSADSRFIGFFTGNQLKRIAPDGGSLQVICDARSFAGGSWNRDGVIVFGTKEGPLQRVQADGGDPKPLLQLDTARQEQHQAWPHFLPDGEHFLYASYTTNGGSVRVGSLRSAETKQVLDMPANASFVSSGLLLFLRGLDLMAQPFDARTLRLEGTAFVVKERIARLPNGMGIYAASPNGTLVYWPEDAVNTLMQAAWYDRNGTRTGVIGSPRLYKQFTLSPDEKRLAVQVRDMTGGVRAPDIGVVDLTSGVMTKVTSGDYQKDTVVWSPDGKELLFGAAKRGRVNPYRILVGGGEPQLVHAFGEDVYPAQWLKDGTMLLLNNRGRFILQPPGGGQPVMMPHTDYRNDGPRVSPDGRWAVYSATESGQWEVYLASFPDFSQKRQISTNGGVQGHWRGDGKEVFYLSLEGHLMSVPIQTGAALEPGIPKPLFRTRIPVTPQLDQYAATADAQRFVMLESLESQTRPFQVIVDWVALTRR